MDIQDFLKDLDIIFSEMEKEIFDFAEKLTEDLGELEFDIDEIIGELGEEYRDEYDLDPKKIAEAIEYPLEDWKREMIKKLNNKYDSLNTDKITLQDMIEKIEPYW